MFLIYVDFKKVVGLPTHKLKQKALSVYTARFGFIFELCEAKGPGSLWTQSCNNAELLSLVCYEGPSSLAVTATIQNLHLQNICLCKVQISSHKHKLALVNMHFAAASLQLWQQPPMTGHAAKNCKKRTLMWDEEIQVSLFHTWLWSCSPDYRAMRLLHQLHRTTYISQLLLLLLKRTLNYWMQCKLWVEQLKFPACKFHTEWQWRCKYHLTQSF